MYEDQLRVITWSRDTDMNTYLHPGVGLGEVQAAMEGHCHGAGHADHESI